jgi:hypothetical protein
MALFILNALNFHQFPETENFDGFLIGKCKAKIVRTYIFETLSDAATYWLQAENETCLRSDKL